MEINHIHYTVGTHYPYIAESDDNERGKHFGIGYELFSSMKKYKNNIGQYILETNTEETYGLMLRKSIRTALNLKSKTSGPDAIIGICAGNHSNSCVPLIAASFLGLRVVTFDGSISALDTSHLIGEVTPNIMFVDEHFASMMENAMVSGKKLELVIFGKYKDYPTFDEYLKEHKDEDIFEPKKLKSDSDTALILFSSGTTGLSKGIRLPHVGILFQAYNMSYSQSISSQSVVCYFTSLNWITATLLLVTCAISGAARVITPIQKAWEAIHKYKISHIYMSPYLVSVLVNEKKSEKLQTESVKMFATTGTRLNSSLRAKLSILFPKTMICQGYGQTESSGWITMFRYRNEKDRELAKMKPDSIGRPVPGMSCKIVDLETGRALGPNQVGELHVKCYPACMNGYFNRDASNEIDDEGWLKTGDLLYYDEDRLFFIVGRCKETLKYRGFQVQPQKLERILESHPAVDKAAVIGITHEVDGDHPMGLVVLNVQDGVSSKEIEMYVEKQVDERQRLRAGVKIINDMPFTSTGKPKRFVLKQWVESGQI